MIRRPIKIIAALLAVALAVQDTAWAAPDAFGGWADWSARGGKPRLPKISFVVPASAGFIDGGYRAPAPAGGAPERLVVLLQDAHANPSAQLNAARILRVVAAAEKVRTIYTEGAEGDVTLSGMLRSGTDPADVRAAAEALVRKGRLAGFEFADLSEPGTFALHGVEDEGLYDEALGLYRAAASERATAVRFLERASRAAETLADELFGAELQALRLARVEHLAGGLSTVDYFARLTSAGSTHGVRAREHRNLGVFRRLVREERRLDFETITSEQGESLAGLTEEDRRALGELSNDAGFLGQSAYWASARERGAQVRRGSQLERYIAYLDRARQLDAAAVNDELERFEEEVFWKMASTADARGLIEVIRGLETLRDLITLQATPAVFGRYMAARAAHDPARLTAFLNAKIHALGRHYDQAVFLDDAYAAAEKTAREFYELSVRRDAAMARNLIARMDAAGETRAVLVAGGYHAPGLERELRARGISYVSIVPAAVHPTDQERYEKILLAQPAAGPTKTKISSAPGARPTGSPATAHLIPRPLAAALRTGDRAANETARTLGLELQGARMALPSPVRVAWTYRETSLSSSGAAVDVNIDPEASVAQSAERNFGTSVERWGDPDLLPVMREVIGEEALEWLKGLDGVVRVDLAGGVDTGVYEMEAVNGKNKLIFIFIAEPISRTVWIAHGGLRIRERHLEAVELQRKERIEVDMLRRFVEVNRSGRLLGWKPDRILVNEVYPDRRGMFEEAGFTLHPGNTPGSHQVPSHMSAVSWSASVELEPSAARMAGWDPRLFRSAGILNEREEDPYDRLVFDVPGPHLQSELRKKLDEWGFPTEGRAVVIGPGENTYMDLENHDWIHFENLLLNRGLNVEIFEPYKRAIEGWSSYAEEVNDGDWKSRMTVHPRGKAFFQADRSPEGSADAAVALSVFSSDRIPEAQKNAIADNLARQIKEGSFAVIGYFGPSEGAAPAFQKTEVEWTVRYVDRIRGALALRGLALAPVAVLREPPGKYTHDIVVYKVVGVSGARMARRPEWIVAMLRSTDDELRQRAVELAVPARPLEAAELERIIKDPKEDIWLRIKALDSLLMSIGDPRVRTRIRRILTLPAIVRMTSESPDLNANLTAALKPYAAEFTEVLLSIFWKKSFAPLRSNIAVLIAPEIGRSSIARTLIRMLGQDDTDSGARRAILEHLHRVPVSDRPYAIKQLMRLMTEQNYDHTVRIGIVKSALEFGGEPGVALAFADLMKNYDGLAEEAARVLGADPGSAAKKIAPIINNDPWTAVTVLFPELDDELFEALELGLEGERKAMDTLLDFVEAHAGDPSGPHAAQILRLLKWGSMRKVDGTEASYPVLVDEPSPTASDPDPLDRFAVLVPRAHEDAAARGIAELVLAAGDDESLMLDRASAIFQHTDLPGHRRTLLDLLNRSSKVRSASARERLRAAIVEALTPYAGDPEVGDALAVHYKRFEEKSSRVLALALAADPARHRQTLFGLLDSDDPEVTAAAVRALNSLPDDPVINRAILSGLGDPKKWRAHIIRHRFSNHSFEPLLLARLHRPEMRRWLLDRGVVGRSGGPSLFSEFAALENWADEPEVAEFLRERFLELPIHSSRDLGDVADALIVLSGRGISSGDAIELLDRNKGSFAKGKSTGNFVSLLLQAARYPGPGLDGRSWALLNRSLSSLEERHEQLAFWHRFSHDRYLNRLNSWGYRPVRGWLIDPMTVRHEPQDREMPLEAPSARGRWYGRSYAVTAPDGSATVYKMLRHSETLVDFRTEISILRQMIDPHARLVTVDTRRMDPPEDSKNVLMSPWSGVPAIVYRVADAASYFSYPDSWRPSSPAELTEWIGSAADRLGLLARRGVGHSGLTTFYHALNARPMNLSIRPVGTVDNYREGLRYANLRKGGQITDFGREHLALWRGEGPPAEELARTIRDQAFQLALIGSGVLEKNGWMKPGEIRKLLTRIGDRMVKAYGAQDADWRAAMPLPLASAAREISHAFRHPQWEDGPDLGHPNGPISAPSLVAFAEAVSASVVARLLDRPASGAGARMSADQPSPSMDTAEGYAQFLKQQNQRPLPSYLTLGGNITRAFRHPRLLLRTLAESGRIRRMFGRPPKVLLIGPGTLPDPARSAGRRYSPLTEELIIAAGPDAEFTVLDPNFKVLDTALQPAFEPGNYRSLQFYQGWADRRSPLFRSAEPMIEAAPPLAMTNAWRELRRYRARGNPIAISGVHAAAEEIGDYGEGRNDMVVAVFSLMYATKSLLEEGRAEFIARLIRSLRPGGRLWIDASEYWQEGSVVDRLVREKLGSEGISYDAYHDEHGPLVEVVRAEAGAPAAVSTVPEDIRQGMFSGESSRRMEAFHRVFSEGALAGVRARAALQALTDPQNRWDLIRSAAETVSDHWEALAADAFIRDWQRHFSDPLLTVTGFEGDPKWELPAGPDEDDENIPFLDRGRVRRYKRMAMLWTIYLVQSVALRGIHDARQALSPLEEKLGIRGETESWSPARDAFLQRLLAEKGGMKKVFASDQPLTLLEAYRLLYLGTRDIDPAQSSHRDAWMRKMIDLVLCPESRLADPADRVAAVVRAPAASAARLSTSIVTLGPDRLAAALEEAGRADGAQVPVTLTIPADARRRRPAQEDSYLLKNSGIGRVGAMIGFELRRQPEAEATFVSGRYDPFNRVLITAKAYTHPGLRAEGGRFRAAMRWLTRDAEAVVMAIGDESGIAADVLKLFDRPDGPPAEVFADQERIRDAVFQSRTMEGFRYVLVRGVGSEYDVLVGLRSDASWDALKKWSGESSGFFERLVRERLLPTRGQLDLFGGPDGVEPASGSGARMAHDREAGDGYRDALAEGSWLNAEQLARKIEESDAWAARVVSAPLKAYYEGMSAGFASLVPMSARGSEGARMARDDVQTRQKLESFTRKYNQANGHSTTWIETPDAFYIFHGAQHNRVTNAADHEGVVDAYAIEGEERIRQKGLVVVNRQEERIMGRAASQGLPVYTVDQPLWPRIDAASSSSLEFIQSILTLVLVSGAAIYAFESGHLIGGWSLSSLALIKMVLTVAREQLASSFFVSNPHWTAIMVAALGNVLVAHRSLAASDKIATIVVPHLQMNGHTKPVVWIEWGAMHADILIYLKHPGLREALIRWHGVKNWFRPFIRATRDHTDQVLYSSIKSFARSHLNSHDVIVKRDEIDSQASSVTAGDQVTSLSLTSRIRSLAIPAAAMAAGIITTLVPALIAEVLSLWGGVDHHDVWAALVGGVSALSIFNNYINLDKSGEIRPQVWSRAKRNLLVLGSFVTGIFISASYSVHVTEDLTLYRSACVPLNGFVALVVLRFALAAWKRELFARNNGARMSGTVRMSGARMAAAESSAEAGLMTEASRRVRVREPNGIHGRPSSMLHGLWVQLNAVVRSLEAELVLLDDQGKWRPDSIGDPTHGSFESLQELMHLGIAQNQEIDLVVRADLPQDQLDRIADLIAEMAAAPLSYDIEERIDKISVILSLSPVPARSPDWGPIAPIDQSKKSDRTLGELIMSRKAPTETELVRVIEGLIAEARQGILQVRRPEDAERLGLPEGVLTPLDCAGKCDLAVEVILRGLSHLAGVENKALDTDGLGGTDPMSRHAYLITGPKEFGTRYWVDPTLNQFFSERLPHLSSVGRRFAEKEKELGTDFATMIIRDGHVPFDSRLPMIYAHAFADLDRPLAAAPAAARMADLDGSKDADAAQDEETYWLTLEQEREWEAAWARWGAERSAQRTPLEAAQDHAQDKKADVTAKKTKKKRSGARMAERHLTHPDLGAQAFDRWVSLDQGSMSPAEAAYLRQVTADLLGDVLRAETSDPDPKRLAVLLNKSDRYAVIGIEISRDDVVLKVGSHVIYRGDILTLKSEARARASGRSASSVRAIEAEWGRIRQRVEERGLAPMALEVRAAELISADPRTRALELRYLMTTLRQLSAASHRFYQRIMIDADGLNPKDVEVIQAYEIQNKLTLGRLDPDVLTGMNAVPVVWRAAPKNGSEDRSAGTEGWVNVLFPDPGEGLQPYTRAALSSLWAVEGLVPDAASHGDVWSVFRSARSEDASQEAYDQAKTFYPDGTFRGPDDWITQVRRPDPTRRQSLLVHLLRVGARLAELQRAIQQTEVMA